MDVIVAVCTYRRNEELTRLLAKLAEYAATHWRPIRLGVTIVDDSPDGQAQPVCEDFADRFALGLVYENSAARNISIARNRALANSLDRAPWIAMTDDDCEPSEEWLTELCRVQAATGAEVATGLMLRRRPDDAPRWLKTQPLLELGEFAADDGQELPLAFTNNCLISTAYLLDHPTLRFDPALGRLGGEDMAFFTTLHRSGAKLVFAAKAFVYEKLPHDRMTLRYQLRRYFWHGNSSVVTSLYGGKTRPRMAVHGLATIARALLRPVRRIGRGQEPQLVYCAAQVCEGMGKLAGTIGVKVRHA